MVSRAVSKAETCVTDNNDATTTREDCTGMNVVQIQPACNSPVIYAIPLKLKIIVSLVTTTQTVKQIHVDCFEIEVADIKGEVLLLFFLLHAVGATAGACLVVPLCIPNIDFPAIASIFSQ